MSAVSNRIFGVAIAGMVAASVFVAPVANAGPPALSMSMSTSSGTTVFNPADFGNSWANPNQTFSHTGQYSQSGQWNLGWSMLTGHTEDAFVILNYVVTNNGLTAEKFGIGITVPLITTIGLTDVVMGGSVTGTLTDLNGNGAELSSDAGDPIYTAFINGSAVQGLLSGVNVTANPFESAVVGPESFGNPIPSDPGPDAFNNIGITLNFILSPGDTASFTSIFVISGTEIPAPGAVALLALAGLAGRRRRRMA